MSYPRASMILFRSGSSFAASLVCYLCGSGRLSRLAPFPAQIHDAKAAVRWLRAHAEQYQINPERIGVWEDSAGGQLAALLGVTDKVMVNVPSSEKKEGQCV